MALKRLGQGVLIAAVFVAFALLLRSMGWAAIPALVAVVAMEIVDRARDKRRTRRDPHRSP